MVVVMEFKPEHAAGVAALCRALGWPTYSDADVAARGGSAPGVCTVVAIDGGELVGFAQAFTDGEAAAYLSQVGVSETHRRCGIARNLVNELFRATGASRMDLVTEDAGAFYRSFPHKEWKGFRLYPDTLSD
ncbi:MAG: GNAT family N-acetyltransferase [Nocardioidaceae bacterium]|nr:GNAT family N-acetyltransferase [Nocardioidaceae bacterium]